MIQSFEHQMLAMSTIITFTILDLMFQHNLDRYTTWPMFARDIGPDSGSALSTQNLYGVHPFYMCIEADGKAHGVFILNSNAQEVETGPGPHLLYRTIGGSTNYVRLKLNNCLLLQDELTWHSSLDQHRNKL